VKVSWSTVALDYAAHNPAALQPRHLEADLRAGVSADDEHAGASFAEECRRLIVIVTEPQVPSGEDGFVTRHGAFKVD